MQSQRRPVSASGILDLARYSLNYLKSVSWRIWYRDNTFTGQRLNQYPTVIDTKLRRATMWSAMSREVSYKGIANAIAVFLAASAGWGAENDSRTWARNTMANLLQQFVETMKSPESVFLQYSRLTSLTLSVLCGQESKHHDLATRAPFPQKKEGCLIAEWLRRVEWEWTTGECILVGTPSTEIRESRCNLSGIWGGSYVWIISCSAINGICNYLRTGLLATGSKGVPPQSHRQWVRKTTSSKTGMPLQ